MKTIINKIGIKLVVWLLMLSVMLAANSFIGCKKRDDSDNTLEYFCHTAGYGVDWIEALLDDFGTLDWVKQKYPNYKYVANYNDSANFASNRIPLGKRNTIDLFFGNVALGLHGSRNLVDLTDVFYNSQVPGEDCKVIDKVLASALDVIGTKVDGQTRYYHMPWSISYGGILYNKVIFDKLGLSVPKTTDELFALMDSVKSMGGKNSAYPYTTSLISSKITYSHYLSPVWWAQYEGYDNYENFYNLIDNNGVKGSLGIFQQQGRAEVLKVFEKMYTQKSGYYDRTSLNYEYKQGQVRLLRGEGGLMMICGDWFSNEMKSQIKDHAEHGYEFEIRAMKTPIISAIVNKTPSIKEVAENIGETQDEVLSRVVDEIDRGAKISEIGVSQEDFDFIRQARGCTNANFQGATTYIPSYASAKELAIDFLRYMATDRANAIYAKNTSGARFLFDYDLAKKAPKVAEDLGDAYLLQSDFQSWTNYDLFRPLPGPSDFKSVYDGGLKPWAKHDIIETSFVANPMLRAEDITNDCVNYYKGNNSFRWDKVVRSLYYEYLLKDTCDIFYVSEFCGYSGDDYRDASYNKTEGVYTLIAHTLFPADGEGAETHKIDGKMGIWAPQYVNPIIPVFDCQRYNKVTFLVKGTPNATFYFGSRYMENNLKITINGDGFAEYVFDGNDFKNFIDEYKNLAQYTVDKFEIGCTVEGSQIQIKSIVMSK